MTSLVDALNGGKVALFALLPTGQLFLGGQTAHSKSLTYELIDISNKAAPNDREFLEGEGRKLADVTSEIIYSSDVAFQFLLDKAESKEKFLLQVRNVDNQASEVDEFTVMVTAISDNPTANTALSSSITLSNTEDFSVNINYSLFIPLGSDSLIDTNGQTFNVRAA